MQEFFRDNGVLVVEELALRHRVRETLQWSETGWYNHWRGKTKVKPAERIVMEKLLQDIRDEVKAGTLNLTEYNRSRTPNQYK